MKKYFILVAVLFSAGLCGFAEEKFNPKFYAFYNGMPSASFEEEAQLLKDMGYAGVGQLFVGGETLVDRVAVYEKQGLDILSLYIDAKDKPIDMALVKGLEDGGMIELTVSKRSPEIIASIRTTVERAAALNIRVALYPHHGFAVATMPQALELIDKVQHANLGVMFNLCHFLRAEKAVDLETILEKASPHLFAVSTCGADTDGKNWTQLIQPLDQGNFPQQRLFAALKTLGFNGPVGLQCFGVKGDRRTNLKSSIDAWQKILMALQ